MFLIAYGLTLIAFAVIDTLWLSQMTGPLYRPMMGNLLAENFRLGAAIAFYAIYAFGITWFVVWPALNGASMGPGLSGATIMSISISAAILGLFAYGTYNLTGLAVLRDWSLKLSLIDMAWGAVVTTLSANIAVAVARLLK